MQTRITNAMSVDVEDYFQVSAFERYVNKDSWHYLPCRVEQNTAKALSVFDRYNVKATFFILGWIAERYPQLVKDVVSAGHEVASHGYSHVRVTQQQPEEFRQDVIRTKKVLEDISGVRVRGYRAASYSINESNLWALDVLYETGHEYSSSVYPIKHDLYGMRSAPRFPFYPRGEDKILEIPVTTFTLSNRKLPCGGGGYFRLLPYSMSRWAIRRVNEHDQQPANFYFHPWELDPDQPRQHGLDMKTRFRHYINLDRMESRLQRLSEDFRWDRMDRVYLQDKGK